MGTTALVLQIDGDVTEINLPSDVRENLQAMYAAIGCDTVDVVRLTSRLDMWIDDEGLYTQPVNLVATALARHFGRTWQDYHGPALLCGITDDGESIDLTADQIRAVIATLGDLQI